jgi:hypothetical protein
MRSLLAFATVAFLGLGNVLFAQSGPVVIELFTSQGCSACPPADRYLTKLAKKDNIIALALHVDYWDYLGWKDIFGQKKFAVRQEKLNTRLKSRYRLVTPQMIVGGAGQFAGGKFADMGKFITEQQNLAPKAELVISRAGGKLHVSISPTRTAAPRSVVQVIRYTPSQSVRIKAGENAGNTFEYTNIVTSWETVAKWDGRKPLVLTRNISGDDPVVVIVQAAKNGPILAARKIP